MTDEELSIFLEDNDAEGAGFFTSPNYYTAIVGLAEDSDGEMCVVYDYERMAEFLVEHDNMSLTEAYEWIDYNVLPTLPYIARQKPIIVYPLDIS